LSDRYSSSPTLRLAIVDSRLRAVLYGILCITTCLALWLICERGYVVCGLLLMPIAARLLWRLRVDAAAGALVSWRSGVWTLEQHGMRRVITPHSRSTVTPWVIYLAFTELAANSTGELWLFADSAPRSQMRQLRVRLTLMR
jgi:hypothetical protein